MSICKMSWIHQVLAAHQSSCTYFWFETTVLRFRHISNCILTSDFIDMFCLFFFCVWKFPIFRGGNLLKYMLCIRYGWRGRRVVWYSAASPNPVSSPAGLLLSAHRHHLMHHPSMCSLSNSYLLIITKHD